MPDRRCVLERGLRACPSTLSLGEVRLGLRHHQLEARRRLERLSSALRASSRAAPRDRELLHELPASRLISPRGRLEAAFGVGRRTACSRAQRLRSAPRGGTPACAAASSETRVLVGREREIVAALQRDLVVELHALRRRSAPASSRSAASSSARIGEQTAQRHPRCRRAPPAPRARCRTKGCAPAMRRRSRLHRGAVAAGERLEQPRDDGRWSTRAEHRARRSRRSTLPPPCAIAWSSSDKPSRRLPARRARAAPSASARTRCLLLAGSYSDARRSLPAASASG